MSAIPDESAYDGRTTAVMDAIREANRRGERPELTDIGLRVKPGIPPDDLAARVQTLVEDGVVFYAAGGYRMRQYVPNVELDEPSHTIEGP